MVMSAQWYPVKMNVKQKLQLFLESPDQHAAPGSPVITGSAPQFHLMSSSSFFFLSLSLCLRLQRAVTQKHPARPANNPQDAQRNPSLLQRARVETFPLRTLKNTKQKMQLQHHVRSHSVLQVL